MWISSRENMALAPACKASDRLLLAEAGHKL